MYLFDDFHSQGDRINTFWVMDSTQGETEIHQEIKEQLATNVLVAKKRWITRKYKVVPKSFASFKRIYMQKWRRYKVKAR